MRIKLLTAPLPPCGPPFGAYSSGGGSSSDEDSDDAELGGESRTPVPSHSAPPPVGASSAAPPASHQLPLMPPSQGPSDLQIAQYDSNFSQSMGFTEHMAMDPL